MIYCTCMMSTKKRNLLWLCRMGTWHLLQVKWIHQRSLKRPLQCNLIWYMWYERNRSEVTSPHLSLVLPPPKGEDFTFPSAHTWKSWTCHVQIKHPRHDMWGPMHWSNRSFYSVVRLVDTAPNKVKKYLNTRIMRCCLPQIAVCPDKICFLYLFLCEGGIVCPDIYILIIIPLGHLLGRFFFFTKILKDEPNACMEFFVLIGFVRIQNL